MWTATGLALFVCAAPIQVDTPGLDSEVQRAEPDGDPHASGRHAHVTVPWFLTVQSDDGRLSADWQIETGAAASSDRDLPATTVGLLALLADGSTMVSGPYRKELKRALRWVLNRDDHGRLQSRENPDWLLDHAMATYALCETARLSKSRLVRQRTLGPLEVLTRQLQTQSGSVDAELLVWSTFCARSGSQLDDLLNESRDPSADDPAPEWNSGAAGLLKASARLTSSSVAVSSRQRAARFLLETLLDVPSLDRLRRWLPPFARDDELAAPLNLDDPIAVWFDCVGLYRLHQQSPDTWTVAWKRGQQSLTVDLAKRPESGGHSPGPDEYPRGSFGQKMGKVGTSASHLLLRSVYYRYCFLEVVR